jgi:hypothetical protein
MLATDAFLQYPDHNNQFHHYGDASDLQLGADLMQDNVPVAYYSRKLTRVHKTYTVGDQDLLSVAKTLNASRTMLYRCPNITVYTDHQQNTFRNITSPRLLRWRLFFDEYRVQQHCLAAPLALAVVLR